MLHQLPVVPGVRLHAMQTDKFKTACFSVNFLRPHSAHDTALDALLPSVLLRGTERYPDIRSISMRLDDLYGATFGTLVRLKGEVKTTGFYADFIEDGFLPAGEGVFAPVLEFLKEVLYHPLLENGCFTAANVEGEKQNLINAIESSLNDKRTYAALRLRALMCEGEAYAVPRLGRAQDVAAITPEELTRHWREVLSGSQTEIFYAGRRAPEEVAAAFRSVFAGQEPTHIAPVATVPHPAPVQVREITERMDVTQGKLAIGLHTGILGTDADYPALMLLNAVFGSGMTSKLFVNVREKLSLCYYASSAVEKYKGLMLVSSGIEFDKYETAKTAILGELEACRRGEISEAELESARRGILSALRAALDVPARLDDYYIGNAIAGGDSVEALIEKITRLSKDDLVRAAQRIRTDTVFFLEGVEA